MSISSCSGEGSHGLISEPINSGSLGMLQPRYPPRRQFRLGGFSVACQLCETFLSSPRDPFAQGWAILCTSAGEALICPGGSALLHPASG